MRASNLFQKITGTSYETGYLTCKSLRWFITATMIICPCFQVSMPACVRSCVCVCVLQWKRCHYRADVCVSCDQGQGHITSGELTLCGQETLLYDFPTKGETLWSQSTVRPHLEVISIWPTKTCGCSTLTTIAWQILISEPYIFLQEVSLKKKWGFLLLCSQGLEERRRSKPPPSLSLAFDFFCVTTIHGF